MFMSTFMLKLKRLKEILRRQETMCSITKINDKKYCILNLLLLADHNHNTFCALIVCLTYHYLLARLCRCGYCV